MFGVVGVAGLSGVLGVVGSDFLQPNEKTISAKTTIKRTFRTIFTLLKIFSKIRKQSSLQS
jgi:hypothetical protein